MFQRCVETTLEFLVCNINKKIVMFLFMFPKAPPRNGLHQIGVTSLHMWYRLRCLPKDFSHKGHVGGSESPKDGDNKGYEKGVKIVKNFFRHKPR